ncbi:PDxFFG protein [Mycoplasmopsis iners]|uniref:PDxFFG protein n=1 Tax=Mycoplasmopsis iners TaxID=76630 RepID=UPI000497D09B|nr:PDxFFG protein [Mycoplasmopsis iners]
MSKKKFNFRTLVWPKYALSAGLLIAAAGITLGSLYAYSNNSDEKRGKTNPVSSSMFKNVFVKDLKDVKANFVSLDKTQDLAQYDFNTDEVKVGNKVYKAEDYLTKFYNQNHYIPVLNIKYGSFNFYNEYVSAVRPKEFFKFTKWFMTNVSWGPEIITLKSFSIVKGVEMKGNSITLGAHANTNKEYTTITFYPDAFFGSLPIYSTLGGEGNASDSLVYQLNQNLLTYNDVTGFLNNVSQYNALANVSSKTLSTYFFRNVIDIRQLIKRKVYVLKKQNWAEKLSAQAINEIEKARLAIDNPYLLLVDGANLEEAKQNLQKKIAEYSEFDKYGLFKDIDVNNLEEKTIIYATINPNEAVDRDEIFDRYLNLTFDDGSEFKVFKSFKDIEYKAKTANAYSIKDESTIESIEKGFKEAQNRIYNLKNAYQDGIDKVARKFALSIDNLEKGKETYLEILSLENNTEISAEEKETQLNELNAKLNEYFKAIANEASQVNDLKDLIKYQNAYNNSELVKNLNSVSPDLSYVEQMELANKYNELHHDYNEKLQKIISPILDGVVFTSTSYAPYTYYVEDLAFLPNQLISIESLQKESKEAQLSWRDLYNINGFLESKRDDLTDTSSTQFYLYAKELSSLEEEYNKKHANSAFKFEFSKLQKELLEINEKSREITAKRSEHENIAIGSSQEGQKSIAQLLAPLFVANPDLPKGYLPLGYNELGPNKLPFAFFATMAYENLKEYLELLYNGNPLAENENDKAGFKNYYDANVKTALETYATQIAEIRELEAKRREYARLSEESENNTELTLNLAYYGAQSAYKIVELDKLLTANNLPTYSQLNKADELNTAIQKALELVDQMIADRQNYINISAESFVASMDARFVNFKVNFLLKSPSFSDEQILEAYNAVIAEYEKERASVLEEFKEKVAKVELEWYKQRSKETLLKIKYAKYGEAFTSKKSKQDYENEKTRLEEQIQEAETALESAKTEVAEKVAALNTTLESITVDNSNVKVKLEEIYNSQVGLIDQIPNKIDEYITNSNAKISQLAQEVEQLKAEYQELTNEQDKITKLNEISRKTIELRSLYVSFVLAEQFKDLFKGAIKQ